MLGFNSPSINLFKVQYYSSGRFGECQCTFCKAALLPKEHHESFIKKNPKKTKCCSSGQVATREMFDQYAELQNAPPQLLELLRTKCQERCKQEGCAECKRLKKRATDFRRLTYALNNSFAFASSHSTSASFGDKGGRADLVKINGDIQHNFSDLFAPPGFYRSIYKIFPF